MATVQSLAARLQQIISPTTKAGVEITAATVGTVDSDKFTKQRALDIYNDARFALFGAMRETMPLPKLTEAISGNVVETQIEFTAASNRYEYTLPTGYLKFVSLDGFSTTSKKMEPILLLPTTYVDMVRLGQMPSYVQTNNIRFVFEIGTKLIHFGTYVGNQTITGTGEVDSGDLLTIVGSGTAFLSETSPNAKITIFNTEKTVSFINSDTNLVVTVAFSGAIAAGQVMTTENYHLKYFGITTYALADVTGGSTVESFNASYHNILIELAEALANEQGMVEVNALAKKLLKVA